MANSCNGHIISSQIGDKGMEFINHGNMISWLWMQSQHQYSDIDESWVVCKYNHILKSNLDCRFKLYLITASNLG